MAIQFNLLPWREQRRSKKASKNKIALVMAVVIGALAGLGYFGIEKAKLADHEAALSYIKQKNKDLDSKLKEKKKLDALKIKLKNQIDAIEALQADRASVSHMVEELSEANTQELFLTQFSLTNGKVKISGIAENERQISDLMRKLRESEWYQEPRLVDIVAEPSLGEEVKRFRITSRLLLPGTDKKKRG